MKIALGVTGSISAYKALDLTRKFTKEGHNVRIILTRGAEKFVRPETFSYLGAERVYSALDDFKSYSGDEGPVLHVSLAKWADKLVVAPLSANTLSKFSQGSAEDLLTSLFLAWKKEKPILLFPAMNTEMLTHPFVIENLEKVSKLKNTFVGPTQSGILACGDVGAGKLIDINEIAELSYTYDLHHSGKKILLTAGATLSPLDDVRFLTNASTGKTALPLIRRALQLGHEVRAIVGKNATKEIDCYLSHPNFSLKRIVSTSEMLSAVQEDFSSCDAYISSAAIGDIEFPHTTGKLKKNELRESLAIKQAPDILATVLKNKKDHHFIVGFAAEKELNEKVLAEKMKRKPVHLLIGTQVNNGLSGDNAEGFGTDSATYRMMTSQNEITKPYVLSKDNLAEFILTHFENFSPIKNYEELQ